MFEELKIGVVIPSYNEGNDLVQTLKNVLNQTHSFAEVLVIDDSSDGTDLLVSSTFGNKVKLIHRERPLGRCSARNLGVKISTSDVVVILNADVCLPPNFCEQLKQKYSSESIDALGVDMVITNTEHPYARYLYAQHLSLKRENIGWTEGFSVRRLTFLKTKGFPDGYPLAILAGEDGELVFDLQRVGAKLGFDFNLKVTTVMPEDLPTIEGQIRGRASLRTLHFVYEKQFGTLLLCSIAKEIRRLMMLLTFIPFCLRIIRLWSYFNHGCKDFVYFAQYDLYAEWLRSHQEWLDLVKFFRLHKQNGWNVIEIFLKPPSKLVSSSMIYDE